MLLVTPQKIQSSGFQHHLNANITQGLFPSANVFSELQSPVSNCPPAISTRGCLISISKLTCPELSSGEPLQNTPHLQLSPPSQRQLIVPVAQTRTLGVTREQTWLIPTSVSVRKPTASHHCTSDNTDPGPRLLWGAAIISSRAFLH